MKLQRQEQVAKFVETIEQIEREKSNEKSAEKQLLPIIRTRLEYTVTINKTLVNMCRPPEEG